MRAVTLLFVFIACVFGPITTRAQPPAPYLFEQLKKPVYQKTFMSLFKGEGNLEPWLKAYIKNRNGVDIPRQFRLIGNQPFELYQVCQPHTCPGNLLFIFFVPDGTQAWALFIKDDGTSRYFGNPDDNIKQALRSVERER